MNIFSVGANIVFAQGRGANIKKNGMSLIKVTVNLD